jgi:hypothetical protein
MGTRYTPSKRLLQQKSWHLSRRAGGKSLIWKAFAVITHEIRTAILEVNGVRFPLSPISSVKKHDAKLNRVWPIGAPAVHVQRCFAFMNAGLATQWTPSNLIEA